MLRNRPAALICLIFVTGMAAGLFLKYPALIAAAAALVPLLIAARLCRKRVRKAAIAALILAFGCLYAALYAYLDLPPRAESGVLYSFTAAVKNVSVYESGTRAELKISDGDSPFDGRTAYMYVEEGTLRPCDVISVRASLKENGIRAKSSGVDYTAYGSFTRAYGAAPKGAELALAALRRRVGDAAERTFGGDAAGFYRALITGDRSAVGTETSASFSRSGILHILAVSGLHFSIVIMGLYRLLLAVIRRKRLCTALASAAALIYAAFTGFTPSVLRAAFMCLAVFASGFFKGRSDPLINLSAALAVLVAVRPYSIANTSLLMSFLATAGIILAANRLDAFYDEKNVKRPLRWLITPAVLSISASLFCMPVYLLSFDFVSLCSPVVNVLASALAAPMLLLAFAAIPLKAVGLGLAARGCEWMFGALRFVSDAVSGFEFSCVSLHTPHIRLVLIPSLTAAASLLAFRVKRGFLVVLGSAAATAAIAVGCVLSVTAGFKDAPLLYLHDSADSFYVFYNDGKDAVLIDGGGAGSAADGATLNGCAYLDAYVVNDCTEDALLRLQRTLPYVPAKTVYLQNGGDMTEVIRAFCENRGCKTELYDNTRGLLTAGLEIYGGKTELPKSPLLVLAGDKDRTLVVYGSGDGIDVPLWDRCSTLVVSRACTECPFDLGLLPDRFESLYIYGYDKSFMTGYFEGYEMADGIHKYTGKLALRLGTDGVYEVNTDE